MRARSLSSPVRRTVAAAVAGMLGAALLGVVTLPAGAAAPVPAAVAKLVENPDISIPGYDIDAFQNPTTQKPAVLWFWNRVQTDAQVDATLQDMHDAGFTETVIFRMDAEAFFSQAWFDRVEHVLRTSQELGMTVWLDNDSQFPSGAAGGLIVDGGTVGDKTYEPRPDLRVKTAARVGNTVVGGGRDVDLGNLFGSSIQLQNGEVIADATSVPGITLLKSGGAWTDYTAKATFTIDAATAGFMVRSPDKQNGYLVDVRKGGNIDFWKQVDGSFSQLRLGSLVRPGWNPDAQHSIEIAVQGSTISVKLDGVDEPPVTDATFPGGRVGMRVDGPQRWRLNELAVTALPGGEPLYANDYSDPGSVGDFDVVVTPVENVIAVTARPAGAGATPDPDDVVDLTAAYEASEPWTAPAGDWRIEAFAYRLKMNGNYADTLDVEAMERYDDIVMEEYYERFPWAFGTVLQGFADDESELSDRVNGDAVPWTPALRERIVDGGTDVARAMVSVFSDLGREGSALRSAFYRAASDQWVDAYWKTKYDWAEEHGIGIISNPLWDEHGPSEGLRLSGNYLTMHQWAQLPGTDLIFNDVGNGAARFLPRTAASVAHQLGRPLVYDELMGATGWERTLDDLREGAAQSALRGINKALYHTTYDDSAGIPYPPVFMKENTWWPWMDDVNTWTGRLMEFGRHETAAPTALLQMQRSNEATQRSAEGLVSDRDWINTMNSLEDSQVDFDLLDEGALSDDPQILAQAEVDGGVLRVGAMTYSTVVVPKAPYLSLEAATTLRDFVASGGELVWAGAAPTREIKGRDTQLADVVAQINTDGGARVVSVAGAAQAGTATAGLGQSAVTLSKANPGVRALRFQEGETDGYLLLNEGGSAVTVDVTFPSDGVPAVWDPETGDVVEATTYRSTDQGTVVPMTLQPRAPLGVTVAADDSNPAHVTKVIGAGEVESVDATDGALTATVSTGRSGVTVLRGTDGTRLLTGSTGRADVPDPVALDGSWTLALENGSSPVARPLRSWTDIAPHFSGSATYTKSVTLSAEQVADADWDLDLGQVADVAEVTVNGTDIGDRIWAPYTIDLGDALHVGVNTIEVRVTNTMGNAKNQQGYESGLLGPVTLEPSVTLPVTLRSTSITATSATAALDADSRGADVSLTVTNSGSTPVTGTVTATGPDGWTAKRSAPMSVPAGGSATGVARLFPGGFVPDGDVQVRVSFVIDDVVVDDAPATLDTSFATPPSGSTDHVDLGDGASEAAHHLTASATSGTNVEAGLTRRYGGYRIPDAWYEFDLAVTAGKGFVLQGLETYDSNPQQKSYLVIIDGQLVDTRLNVRPQRQEGTAAYRLHVPARFVGSDTVRVRLQSRSNPDFADPSLADVWALPFMGDVKAPDVAAHVTSAVQGEAGWFRAPAAVAIDAVDDRDEAPVVEVGIDAGWAAYAGPVQVGAEGTTTVYYRARDAAGNSTGTQSVAVRIDRVAPATTVEAKVEPGVENADTATLRFAATDTTSGVAATRYRIDEGAWTVTGSIDPVVQGFGEHRVEFASADVAGNTEATHTVVVTLSDVAAVAAVAPPQVTGVPTFGSTLTATSGSWNTTGLAFAFQWLRDGTPIPGATAATYEPGVGDVGRRLSVTVTASKPGKAPGTATSSETAPVAKAASSVKASVNKTKVKAGKKVRVAAVVSAPGASPSGGKVQFVVDGKTVETVALTASGKATVKVKIAGRGKHRLLVRYLGSPTVAASDSATLTVKGK